MRGGTCVTASVEARALVVELVAETGLFIGVWCGVDEDSGEDFILPSFNERRPLVMVGDSWEFDPFLDSVGEEGTPRVGVELLSRALPLFLPYYAKIKGPEMRENGGRRRKCTA
jgi:hypothetical protein